VSPDHLHAKNPNATASPSHVASSCFCKGFTEEWLFRATLRNSLRAWVAAQQSSWLRVPEVLNADERQLRIDYEFLEGWNPLHTVLRDRGFAGFSDAELEGLFWTCGAALEEFHRRTHRIHGDFDFDNVLVKRGADKVAFVDFTPPEYSAFRRYNQESPYRDIATFVFFVRAKYPPQLLHLAFRPQLRELARSFMEGYFREAPAEYDRFMLERHMNELLRNTYLGKTFSARYMRRSRLFRTDDLAPEL
jgi:tRNA A-37 threonylcarbamoyl transferase component Bud32